MLLGGFSPWWGVYQLLRATDTFYLDCACPIFLCDMLRQGCITATALNSGCCYSISQLLLELCSNSPRCSTCILIGGGYIKIHMGGGSMQSCPIPGPFASHSRDPCGIPQPLPLPRQEPVTMCFFLPLSYGPTDLVRSHYRCLGHIVNLANVAVMDHITKIAAVETTTAIWEYDPSLPDNHVLNSSLDVVAAV